MGELLVLGRVITSEIRMGMMAAGWPLTNCSDRVVAHLL